MVLSERHFIRLVRSYINHTTTRTAATWVSARILRTGGLLHSGHRRRLESLHCHEWVDFIIDTNGATLRKAVFVAPHRLAGTTIEFSAARIRRLCDLGT